MKKMEFYGIWIYAVLCLILVLVYRFYTEMFEIKILNYNLSLWYALIINLVLFITAIISVKKSILLGILGIVFSPLSTYLFFKSWTDTNYEFLTLFLAVPIILLLISILKIRRIPNLGKPVNSNELKVGV